MSVTVSGSPQITSQQAAQAMAIGCTRTAAANDKAASTSADASNAFPAGQPAAATLAAGSARDGVVSPGSLRPTAR